MKTAQVDQPTVAIYARVSTADQNCEMQLAELRRWCAMRKWKIHSEYVDTGWSGSKASRPQLNRLKQDARERRFDCVAVWKLDRWGRSMSDSIIGIQELVALGIRWIAITQNLDTDESNPMSRFMLQLMAAFAELEREMIRERVRAGLKNAMAKGIRCGRPAKVFDRLRAKELHQAKTSVRNMARLLGVSKGTVQRFLASQPQAKSDTMAHMATSSMGKKKTGGTKKAAGNKKKAAPKKK